MSRLIFVFSLAIIVYQPAIGQLAHISRAFVTPSDLNKDRHQFDGKLVTVRGYIINENENSSIWDKKSDETSIGAASQRCISFLYPKKMEGALDKLSRHQVFVTGVFDENVSRSGRVYMGLCNLTAIRLTSLPELITN